VKLQDLTMLVRLEKEGAKKNGVLREGTAVSEFWVHDRKEGGTSLISRKSVMKGVCEYKDEKGVGQTTYQFLEEKKRKLATIIAP